MNTKKDTQQKYVSVTKASEITGRPVAEIEQLCRTGKVCSKVVLGEWFLSDESLFGYFNLSLASDLPLVHLAEKKALDNKKGYVEKSFSAILGKAVNVLTAITLVFGGYYTIFTPQGIGAMREVVGYVEQTLDYSTDTMAFVGYSVLGTVEGGQSANILTALKNYLYPSGTDIKKVSAQGMVVAPSSGDGVKDRDLIAQIKDSFSDEVSVIPGEDGRSGIVKPIFKKRSGQSYMYVMVPVKE